MFEMTLYDFVSEQLYWRTTERPESFYFIDRLGDHAVMFLSDHVVPGGAWSVTHGKIAVPSISDAQQSTEAFPQSSTELEDFGHLRVGQLEIEHLGVFLDVPTAGRLRDSDDVLLLD